MEWIILFVFSWIMLLMLIDFKQLKINVWNGVLAALLQYAVDTQAMIHELYKVENPIISISGSSLFFILGPVFVIGTLMAQFHPSKKIFIAVNVLVLAGLYSLAELFLLRTGVLVYTDWHSSDSIVVNISAMIILSWFPIIVLGRKVKQ